MGLEGAEHVTDFRELESVLGYTFKDKNLLFVSGWWTGSKVKAHPDSYRESSLSESIFVVINCLRKAILKT